MRRGDLISAWTEYDFTTDADDPQFADVEVVFRITHPGCAPSFSNVDGGDPGDPPEGEIEEVLVQAPRLYPNRGPMLLAPPDIDAWARRPDRTATLFQQALDNAGRDF